MKSRPIKRRPFLAVPGDGSALVSTADGAIRKIQLTQESFGILSLVSAHTCIYYQYNRNKTPNNWKLNHGVSTDPWGLWNGLILVSRIPMCSGWRMAQDESC